MIQIKTSENKDLGKVAFTASVPGTSLVETSLNSRAEAVGQLILSDGFRVFGKIAAINIEIVEGV